MYCTGMLVQPKQGEGRDGGYETRESLTRGNRNGDRQTDRMKRIGGGSRQTVESIVSGKDITGKGKGVEERENRHKDNKAKTRETADAKHWRRNPNGGGKEKTKARCGIKRKVWWRGRLAQ